MVARLLGFCLFVTGLTLAGVAIVTNLPWLIAENRRLEPWKIPLVWSSEAAALVCFVRYGLRTLLPVSFASAGTSRLTFKTFAIAAFIDFAFSIDGMIEERWAHWRAVPAQARVFAGHSLLQHTGHRRYTLTCQFIDRAGDLQTGWYSLLEAETPFEVRKGVDDRKLPVDLNVSYDPEWPSRNWPADVPYSDDNRMFLYSLITLLFSGMLTANLAVLRWWFPALPPPEVGPFSGATLSLLGAGLLQGW
jgi:hypothetical protein